MLTFTIAFDDKEGNPRTLRYYGTLAGDNAGRTKALLADLDPDLDLTKLRPDDLAEHFADFPVKIRVTIRRDRDDRSIQRNNIQSIEYDDEAEE